MVDWGVLPRIAILLGLGCLGEELGCRRGSPHSGLAFALLLSESGGGDIQDALGKWSGSSVFRTMIEDLGVFFLSKIKQAD